MPENTIYVGRPTKWGNPFVVGKLFQSKYPVTKKQTVGFYKEWLLETTKLSEVAKAELKGKNLACWCPLDEPCHADVLLPMQKEIIEAIKELLRVMVLAAVPVIITSLERGSVDYREVLVVMAIAGLKALDKYLHEIGKETGVEEIAKGLTRF